MGQSHSVFLSASITMVLVIAAPSSKISTDGKPVIVMRRLADLATVMRRLADPAPDAKIEPANDANELGAPDNPDANDVGVAKVADVKIDEIEVDVQIELSNAAQDANVDQMALERHHLLMTIYGDYPREPLGQGVSVTLGEFLEHCTTGDVVLFKKTQVHCRAFDTCVKASHWNHCALVMRGRPEEMTPEKDPRKNRICCKAEKELAAGKELSSTTCRCYHPEEVELFESNFPSGIHIWPMKGRLENLRRKGNLEAFWVPIRAESTDPDFVGVRDINAAHAYAKKHGGSQYEASWLELLGLIGRHNDEEDGSSKTQFCSELVFNLLEEMKILDEKSHSANNCMPGDFETGEQKIHCFGCGSGSDFTVEMAEKGFELCRPIRIDQSAAEENDDEII